MFDMLLPMLGVYQEYVRNHHYSLQVLAEYKMKEEFNRTLKRCEEKSQCEGRSIESFLTCPMYQIPRYLVTLHEILAHTPHEHVDRTNLEYAKRKLETLSQVIHDEVSETENIRKNLAIERMISDGCDILLDANQVFVRQGTLVQVTMNKTSYPCPRIGQLGPSSCEKKERLRQAFLFTNHLLIATRTNSGRLKLAKKNGKIPLHGCTLIEDMPFDISQDDSSHGSPPQHETPEGGLSPVSRTLSIHSFGGQEDTITTEAQQGQSQQSQPAPPSPPWNLVPAKLAHGSLMLAALALGTTGTDNSGKPKRDTRTGSFNRKTATEHSDDDSPTRVTTIATPSSAVNAAANHPHQLDNYKNLMFQITWPGDDEENCSIWFQSIDYLNTFLLTYRIFTTGPTIIAVLRCVLRDPLIQLASTKINADLFDSMLQAKPGCGRRASQQHNDTLPLPGVKGGRRVSTGMLDAKRHQIFIPRRHLATEHVLEEEEWEDSSSDNMIEGVDQLRLRSASEGNKPTLFPVEESTKVTGKAGGKKISFEGSKISETPTKLSSKEGSSGLLPIGEEHQRGIASSVKKEENAYDKISAFKVPAKPSQSKPSPLSKYLRGHCLIFSTTEVPQ
ncbi:unnamed protein product [Rodentolepis nana]|uniref:DH domain-containing protein n=1 Tax=Rodentolepis nana TaxID=102285 RepID=A0A3P7SWL8_RODNA|nr:unnamed protein product [Rodentolepis nana]